MRKQKLDKKRRLHLLGVRKLNYLHETKKIQWQARRENYTSENSEKGLEMTRNFE